MGRFMGILYGYLFYSSISAGYAGLYCPLLPVIFFSNKFYRYLSDVIVTFWQYYPTALLQLFYGCDVQVTGDSINTGETSIVVSNHRTRTDWNFLWPIMYHGISGKSKISHSTKFILKDGIRHIPGPGWAMQLGCFIYIKRSWEADRETFKKFVDYVARLCYKHTIILFPEGTDLTENTKKSSQRYAKKNDLPIYENVLHPRTTGFTYLTHQLLLHNAIDAVYDVTLIYPDVVPQNEKVLLSGNFPKVLKAHLIRYPIADLPKTEEDLKQFLIQKWAEKEKTIEEFKTTGQFLHGKILRSNKIWDLYLAFTFWTALPFVVVYLLFYSHVFRHIVLAHTVFLIFINIYWKGFQNFEIALYNLKKGKLKYLIKKYTKSCDK